MTDFTCSTPLLLGGVNEFQLRYAGMPENASSSLDVGMVHFYSCVIAIICLLVVNNAIGRDLRLVV